MVYLFYTTYINVDLAHHELFRAKSGKDGVIVIGVVASESIQSNRKYF